MLFLDLMEIVCRLHCTGVWRGYYFLKPSITSVLLARSRSLPRQLRGKIGRYGFARVRSRFPGLGKITISASLKIRGCEPILAHLLNRRVMQFLKDDRVIRIIGAVISSSPGDEELI